MDTTAQANYFPSLPPSILADVRNVSEEFSVEEILEFINNSKDILSVLHDNSITMLSDSNFQLGILCALTLSLRTTSVRITGQWENVLWEIVDLALYWGCNNIAFYNLVVESTTLKSWMLTIFSDPELCPNPYLRLQMIHLIGIWPRAALLDATSGMQAAAGLVINLKYMDLYHLMPDIKYMNSFRCLIDMLISLDQYGHLAAIAVAAVDQLRRINVGPQLSLLYNLLQVLNQMAVHSLDINEQYRLHMSESALDLYGIVLNDLRTTREAYGAHGLAKVAADTLLTITSSILTIGSTLQNKNERRFMYLMFHLNTFYRIISRDKAISLWRSIYQVLRLDHAENLSFLIKKAKHSGIFFHHSVVHRCQESSEVVPEEFRDSVTQTLMENPVLLHSSKMVIDESTLLRLLLEFPSNPFTRDPLDDGSYIRLPELQASILAWKKSYGIINLTEKLTMNKNVQDVCEPSHLLLQLAFSH